MKRIMKAAVALGLISVVLCVAGWVVASNGLVGDVEFGYYGGFNIAEHAIQQSGCADVIEYSGVNKDLFLEEFHFKVTTKSGRVVRLWFDASNMDVAQVCYKPVGFSVIDSAHETAQRYSIAGLSELLKEKHIQVTNLKDVVCNIDQLDQIFRAHNGDAGSGDSYVWDYLRIEFPTEEGLGSWIYTNVRDKDVTNWP